ncbi:type II toxin-antitoxin system death-on-curing family toxin [Spirochaeta lutea]|uniref:Death-on-curing protein n=1 Tax=Spirochaeta lutea TaxID=1480694 RepID=A0A098QZF3_9SPIO|nr:type II toxin-antitoxin system death-on-curing family toxin [Spirochaeta lutea]KGE73290.1 death-on-curing protein [Spirochaeta lutea]
MSGIRFLTYAEVLLIHQDQLLNYGGTPDLRDSGLLSSALAMPETSFSGAYLHQSLFDKAAAYLFHICQNHPFIDGNKRVGLAAALVFLDINGLEVFDENHELYPLVMQVASGECKKEDISQTLERLAK